MQVFGERYELIDLIDEGGIGAVFRVRDRVLDREVALKRLLQLDDPQAQELARASLAREATILSAVQHPNIVTIFDVGFDGDGTYVVMELIAGQTLSKTVRRSPLTLDAFRELARQSLDGLVAAQAANILHRDLKPSNIMMWRLPSGAYQVKILDFGLAKFSQRPVLQTADQENAILGSIYFLAPEQFERKPVDGRADLYALGCIFYYALTKKYPFTGQDNGAVMQSHLKHRVRPIQELRHDLPPQVASWVMRLIERYPDDRPATAEEALNEMHSLMWNSASEGSSPQVVTSGRDLPVERPVRQQEASSPSRIGRTKAFGFRAPALVGALLLMASLAYYFFVRQDAGVGPAGGAVFAAATTPSPFEERRIDLSSGWMKSLTEAGKPTMGFITGQSRRAFTLLTRDSEATGDSGSKIFQTFDPLVLKEPGQKLSLRFYLTFHRRELTESALFSFGFFDSVSRPDRAFFARVRLVPTDDGQILEVGRDEDGLGLPSMDRLFEGPMEAVLTEGNLPAGGGLDNSLGSHEFTLGLERMADPPKSLSLTFMWKNVNGDGIVVKRGIIENSDLVVNGLGFYFTEPKSKLTVSDVEILLHNPIVQR